MRELDQQKRRLVDALMAQVRAVAAAAGRQVTVTTAQGAAPNRVSASHEPPV